MEYTEGAFIDSLTQSKILDSSLFLIYAYMFLRFKY